MTMKTTAVWEALRLWYINQIIEHILLHPAKFTTTVLQYNSMAFNSYTGKNCITSSRDLTEGVFMALHTHYSMSTDHYSVYQEIGF